MEYPASQHQNVVIPDRRTIVPRPHPGVRGVRIGGHGNTRQIRMSQPHPDYEQPAPMNPEYDPPQWSFHPSQESQSQWSRPLYSSSQHEPDWSNRPYSQSQNEPQWSGARASVDSYFQNYQFATSQPVEEEDGDEGVEEDDDEEENDEEEEETDEEEVQNTRIQPRPVAEGSSRTGVGKYMSKMMKRFSTWKNKGIEPSKYTPSTYK